MGGGRSGVAGEISTPKFDLYFLVPNQMFTEHIAHPDHDV